MKKVFKNLLSDIRFYFVKRTLKRTLKSLSKKLSKLKGEQKAAFEASPESDEMLAELIRLNGLLNPKVSIGDDDDDEWVHDKDDWHYV